MGKYVEDNSQVWIRSGQSRLRPVLESWTSECHRFYERMHDACWWYNERANVGILAIAAAKTEGWVALEEFSTTKGRIVEEEGKSSSHGRCDLYIAHPKVDYAIEFKQAWQTLFPRSVGKQRYKNVSQGWKDAWDATGCLQSYEAEKRMAGLFIAPHSPAKHSADKVREAWDELCDFVRNLDGVMAVATYWLGKDKMVREAGDKEFPGVILALRERKRSA